MILMGSQAARLRGDLPSWSSPDLTDYDIVGSEAEFEALVARARAAYPLTIAHARPNSRRAIRIPVDPDDFTARVLVDWVDDTVESSQLLAALDDHTDGEVFGLPCRVISAVTELEIKRAILPFQADPSKTQRWIDWWTPVVGGQPISDGLQAFVDQMVAEYQALRTPA